MGTTGALYAGIDIGGTKLYALITDEQGKILGRGRKKTKPQGGFEKVMERVSECYDEALREAGVLREEIRAIGIGAPSPILPDGIAVNAPNMGWDHVPIVKTATKLLGAPVYAENDCNVGTLGEFALGAGKGARTLVGLFMGTGLGGGIVIGGHLITGENRQAAEVGHMVVVRDGRKCGCGHRGCLEAYASKTGMGRRLAEEILVKGRDSLLEKICGTDLFNIRSGILQQAWEAHDPVATETLREAAEYLGIGIGNLITLLGPDIVVVGGGVFEALGEVLLPIVIAKAKETTHPPSGFKDVRIVLARLGDEAVALGAMVYARENAPR